MGLGGEVVEQPHLAQTETPGQFGSIQLPGQVGHPYPLVLDWPGQGDAGRQWAFARQQEVL
ncbi:hypothetical protein D3C81_1795140 [compost metagenome]